VVYTVGQLGYSTAIISMRPCAQANVVLNPNSYIPGGGLEYGALGNWGGRGERVNFRFWGVGGELHHLASSLRGRGESVFVILSLE